jgi:hypothetical protein
MSKNKLAHDKESAFISFYLAEKEFFYPDKLREALTLISYLITVKGKDKAIAIAQVNTKFKEKKNIDYTREFLWKRYNSRLAYIKNAKDKFKLWEIEMRERNAGIIPKLCECGCGQEVKNKNNKFINGHNARCRSKQDNIRRAIKMRDSKKPKKNNKVIYMNTKKP